jgi:Protocatechuate 3,4-dioxygenase beta subunit
MDFFNGFTTRRGLLRSGVALGGLSLFTPGVFADLLSKTPKTTEGPFYPDKLPIDTDNDLLIVNNGITPAVGEVTYLTGRVLTPSGEPLRGAMVEIWQVDGKGVYLHTGDSTNKKRDTNFQGFGRCATSWKGEYCFRTVKPVPYPGRTPHIHVKVFKGSKELLCTQLFVNGHAQNKTDGVLRELRDPLERELVMVDFKPMKESKLGELGAKFDIVLGSTPADRQDDHSH